MMTMEIYLVTVNIIFILGFLLGWFAKKQKDKLYFKEV